METISLRDPVPAENHGVATQLGGHITRSAILNILIGVCAAIKLHDQSLGAFERWVSSSAQAGSSKLVVEEEIKVDSSAESWISARLDVLPSSLYGSNGELRQIINLALVIAFPKESRRQSYTITGTDSTMLCGFVYDALTGLQLTHTMSTVSYSAQGFLVVPLCSFIGQTGGGNELYRLHVWLPGDQRGDPDFCIHSYQALMQSWILNGELCSSIFKIDSTVDPEHATHAEHKSILPAMESLDVLYGEDQIYPSFRDTGRLVRAIKTHSSVQTFNMSYRIEPGTWHTTEVASDTLHASIVLLDSYHASGANTSVWETLFDEGNWHARRSEMKEALRVFNKALSLCETVTNFPNAPHYARLVHGELGFTNRCLGRYDLAIENLEEALKEPGPNHHRVKVSGELGTIYRTQKQLPDAKVAFETQYETAKELDEDRAMCRTIGDLGMTNYQLFQQNHDDALLELAVEQLQELVDRARHIKGTVNVVKIDPRKKFGRLKHASVWESIGLNRLSLCYTAQGNTREAIRLARESQNIKIEAKDLTVIAMLHFFCGRALLKDRQREAALEHFNPALACTPVIALCKEPSEKHRQYLQKLVEVGEDMDMLDEYGYMALDYAVFGNDSKIEDIIIDGFRHTLEGDTNAEIARCQSEARLRKGYRELFHDNMRLVLLSGCDDSLRNLRIVYADAIAVKEQETMTRLFDTLKYVSYSDFLRCGRLPRYSDGFTKELISRSSAPQQGVAAEFLIFFSYRWKDIAGKETVPDDADNSQYHRMVKATKEFLNLHPSVEPERLGIWLDYACIDQNNPAPGVAALPMLLAQCDAVISLVEDSYYKRAWCALEVIIVQTLKRAYQKHLWYEHEPSSERDGNGKEWALRAGPLDLEITAADKELTVEEDRPKISFLEWQTKLLR